MMKATIDSNTSFINETLLNEQGFLSIPDFIVYIYKYSNKWDIAEQLKKRGKQYDIYEYYNVPAAFDIEASSFMMKDPDTGNDIKAGCMYIWQFGINGKCTYGRTWDEYEKFIKALSNLLKLGPYRRLPVYVHNLSYEFQWIRKHFEWDNVFLAEARQPYYALDTNGIEYRCSYKLSSMSLAAVGNNLVKYKIKKKVGDLDYNLVRTPITPLTDTELGYCENDVRVVMAYIQEKIEQDGDVTNIPLTNTGYVRRYVREACFCR